MGARKRVRKKDAADRLIEKAAADQVRLKLSVQDEDWVAIEGDRASLAFLGELLLEFSKQRRRDYLILDSPELGVFQEGSLGIYICRRAKP